MIFSCKSVVNNLKKKKLPAQMNRNMLQFNSCWVLIELFHVGESKMPAANEIIL